MYIRDRIQELRRVKASQLRPHPKNWRKHPQAQQDALRGLLAEIGYADALLVRELSDGSLQLLDGHLRAETTPDAEVPVLVVDLDDGEAAKLLALHDSLTGMAEPDENVLADLFGDFETDSPALQNVLDGLLDEPETPQPHDDPTRKPAVPEAFQVIVQCADEAQQQQVYQRLTAEGWKCTLLTI